MKKALAAALVAAALASCGKKQAPAPAPETALQSTADSVPVTPPCSKEIPAEWSSSQPLPALKDGKLVYRMFFFAWDGNPKKGIKVSRAAGEATFTPDGQVLDCRQSAGDHAATLPEPELAMSQEELERRRRDLSSLTEEAASLYAAGKPLSEAQKKTVADFGEAFAAFETAGQASDDRALSPDFWAWVEKNGGRAPKP